MDEINTQNSIETKVQSNRLGLNLILKILVVAGLIVALYLVFVITQTLVYSRTTGGWGDLGAAIVYGVYILPTATAFLVVVIITFIRRLWKWGVVGLMANALLFLSWPLANVVTNVHPKVVRNEAGRYEQEAKLHEFELQKIKQDRLYPSLLFEFGNTYEIQAGETKSLVIKARYEKSQEPLKIKLTQIRQDHTASPTPKFVSFSDNGNNSGSLVLNPSSKNIGGWLLVFEVTVTSNPDFFKEEFLRINVIPAKGPAK